ncbi:MAG TPA: hypothetical protein G4N97_00170 [Thermoflexia bacterium]|nr:hypothetical protein [Thermoflexia bacterium]
MRKAYLVILIVLAILTLLSLTLNATVILSLMRARQIALDTVADARALVTDIGDDTFSYTLEVNQEIPIATGIPFNEEVTVPINTTIPINTTVIVPIDLGVTTYNLEVPIRTVIPVDLEFTVPVSQTVSIATTVPLDVDVPLEIAIAETPLVGYLEQLDAALAQIEARLRQPFGNGD